MKFKDNHKSFELDISGMYTVEFAIPTLIRLPAVRQNKKPC
jgi:hypothetical protein